LIIYVAFVNCWNGLYYKNENQARLFPIPVSYGSSFLAEYLTLPWSHTFNADNVVAGLADVAGPDNVLMPLDYFGAVFLDKLSCFTTTATTMRWFCTDKLCAV
jgi:hypothetical protein